ncbi:DNA translocase FtsK [Nesterenkonia rhizosphaerae]|uniref:FtsK gamma domain-containing protein n=1 Tax=Nesterenkonia rhizosphaerae TaxID=1348272 RepID=A0ABP9G0N5_9MICC
MTDPGAEVAEEVLFQKARDLVTSTRSASVGLIVRRLNVSFPEAHRLLDRLEAEGSVGPREPWKARDVIAEDTTG